MCRRRHNIFALLHLRGTAAYFDSQSLPRSYRAHTLRARRKPHSAAHSEASRLAARPLPPQEALGKGGELAFPVLNEVALGHELIELLSLL